MFSQSQQKTQFPKAQLNELSQKQLIRQTTIGFIVVSGGGALYGILHGKERKIITKFQVELPKRVNGQAGSSSIRFARLRVQKRYNYLCKVSEVATQVFISDNKCNVDCLILASTADFINDLFKNDFFDQRLSQKVANNVCVSYGFENGFTEAIEKTLGSQINLIFESQQLREQKESPKELELKKQVKIDTQEQNIKAKLKEKEKEKMQVDLDFETSKHTDQIVPE